MRLDANDDALVDVSVYVFAPQSETRADRRVRRFGVQRREKVIHRDVLFELIEIANLTRRIRTEERRLGQMGAGLIRDVYAKGDLLNRLAESTTGGAAVAGIFRFLDEGFVHGSPCRAKDAAANGRII